MRDGERRWTESGGERRDNDACDDDVVTRLPQIVISSSQVSTERAPVSQAVQRQRLRGRRRAESKQESVRSTDLHSAKQAPTTMFALQRSIVGSGWCLSLTVIIQVL